MRSRPAGSAGGADVPRPRRRHRMSKPHLVRRLATLSSIERRLVIKAFWELFRARASLRMVPLGELLNGTAPGSAISWQPVRSGSDIHTIVWAVQAAAARLPGTTCLAEALVAQRLLWADGHPAQLRIGVRG